MQQGQRPRVKERVLGAALAGLSAMLIAPQSVLAQANGSRAVVQPLPDPASKELADALRVLAANPQSVPTLITAGQAALKLDDLDAAEGFFTRAQALAPADGKVKAGLASIHARRGQALPALKLFDEAEAAGAPMALYAGDRGLAFDLIGDNVRAQQQYRQVLAGGSDGVVSQRLAISQAIAGDQRAADATLLPMLQQQDLSAYRTRSFALAILGRTDEAVTIAETLLPARISSRMAPYLRYMPRLTHAQQAAAANLGLFPRAAEIGRDDPALASYGANSAPAVPLPPVRSADARLAPAGEPLGPSKPPTPATAPAPATQSASAQVRAAQQPAAPARAPVPAPVPAAAPAKPVAVAVAAPPPQSRPATPPAPTPAKPAEFPRPSFSVNPAGEVQGPPVPAEIRPAPPSAPATPPAAPPAAAPPPPPEPVSLAEAFAEFGQAKAVTGPSAGAVDITHITPVREERKPPPPPPPPPVPARVWVQVATGRDTGALAFDWRRIKRKADAVLGSAKPYVARWGQTNRLVTGPYPNDAKANEAIKALKAAGIDSFRFNSAEGEQVRPLG